VHSLACTAPAGGRLRRVTTVHGLNYAVVPEAHFGLRLLGMRALVPLVVRRFDRVIAVSHSTRDDLVRAAARASSQASATAGLLVHSPMHLFILPAMFPLRAGLLISGTVLAHVHVLGPTWAMHALIGGALAMIVGVQVLSQGLCAHAYGRYFMNERDPWFDRMRARLAVVSAALFVIGVQVFVSSFLLSILGLRRRG
jgi:hypothetical protein